MSAIGGRGRRATVAAVVLWVACLGLVLGSVAIDVVVLARGGRVHLGSVAVVVFALTCGTVGGVVGVRRPGLPFGWLLLTAGMGSGLAALGTSAIPLIESPSSPFLPVAAMSVWLWAGSVTLIGVFLLLRFPDGRPPSWRWRLLEWATGISLVLSGIGVAAQTGRVEGTRFPNPLAVYGSTGTALSSLRVAYAIPFFAVFAVFASVVTRFRRSSGVERQQLKWIFASAVVILLGGLVEFALPDLLHNQATETSVDDVISGLTVSLLPVAIGISVLRYRLWNIDRLINRTIVYAVLTLLLVAVYTGLVVSLGAVTGRTGNSVVIAGSTLVVAALFGPARRRIQALIDRRFFRRRYDAERVLAAFSSRLRDELDMESVSGELRVAVADAVEPSSVTLWFRGTGGRP